MKSEIIIISNIAAVLLLNILVFPLILIWGINTLLGMHIEFSLLNWLASCLIISSISGAQISLNK